MTRAYVALGSNLDNPGLQLQRAVDEIDSASGIQITGCSKLYLSVPLTADALNEDALNKDALSEGSPGEGSPGEEKVPEDQPDYCNAVVEIDTTLQPTELLDAMQTIENNHGRVRSVRWGPRTLDLDILLYGNETIESERLTVPHYQMHVRNFVLCPLHDIAPSLSMPDGRTVEALLQTTGKDGLKVIADQYPWF
ncbi:2-amino-4-hydroxy-6-hydroxymethyldihydropteridine diphosphokinase [Endozoicomonas gorgoniicola]|uniref:2-amino-4-hydroxy-6-hydroxymethyldihydropteridine pyrophosphokinase n=1 Tax=Endozoicomonas gorgoniicola TaxID=1234144 RepID=A0ABT3N272_9GAMM|nr:2-amino-4-hydroxy-6-hydroxymethyldihydropteridine diphosphokinase [Endozoicomonas gorgoniicola]MCW7555721.1 2-amino-4-hydroxy-6-hydroxymethyldihydropteridine diphosphokinase [Endozoicomonas gorgoniicola]